MNPPLSATHKDTPVRVYHIENGSAYVAFSDGTTDYVAWNALRLPEATALKLPPEISPAPPTPSPSVLWAEWVEVSDHVILRPGVSEDGTQHKQTVVLTGNGEWAWKWHRGGSMLRKQEGYSSREWARRDCEAYTAGKTAPAGPTPANAGNG